MFQAAKLSEFYEICKSLDIARGERFIKIEQVCDFLWVSFQILALVLFVPN